MENGPRSILIYDNLGQLAQTIYAKGTSEERSTFSSYDANGHVKTRTDELGNVTTMDYDAVGRTVQTAYADGTVDQTFYDAAGRVSVTADRHVPGQQTHGTRSVYCQRAQRIDPPASANN